MLFLAGSQSAPSTIKASTAPAPPKVQDLSCFYLIITAHLKYDRIDFIGVSWYHCKYRQLSQLKIYDDSIPLYHVFDQTICYLSPAWGHRWQLMWRRLSFKRGGGGDNIRFRLSQHLRILLFIAGEPQKLGRQKYKSLESSFHKLLKNTAFRHLRAKEYKSYSEFLYLVQMRRYGDPKLKNPCTDLNDAYLGNKIWMMLSEKVWRVFYMQEINFCAKVLVSQDVAWPAKSFTGKSLWKVHLWVNKCQQPGKSLVLMHASDVRNLKLSIRTILHMAWTLRTFFKITLHIYVCKKENNN